MQNNEADFNGGAVVVEKPVRWSKDRLAKLEDLELALDAAVHVNRYLNKEIEAVVQQLQRSEQERHAWQEHARRLARQLAKYKRAAAGMGSVSCSMLCLIKCYQDNVCDDVDL
jgi:hypothetical protein